VFLVGIVVSCVLGWELALSGDAQRLFLAGRIGHYVLMVLPVAALAVGWMAYRMPRLVRVRCWKCGWRAAYKTGWGD